MKYSVKLLLRDKATAKGLLPVYFCITIDGIRKYISSGISLRASQWNQKDEQVKEAHAHHKEYNMDLTERKAKMIREIVEQHMAGAPITTAGIKSHFTQRRDPHNIFHFIDAFIEECRGKKTDSTLENYRKHSLRLERFHGSRSLAFEEITPEYLKRYETNLRAGSRYDQPVGNNYIHAIWTTLRTFFNAAKKRGVISCYPFHQYENPTYNGPVKEYLTLRELEAWEKYAEACTHPILRQAAIYLLFGCYTGLRLSDWLQFDPERHIVDGRIRIRAKKNGEWVTMRISAPLRRNLERMAACPLTAPEPVINRRLKDIATELKIDKRVTSHTGRHTFAISVCADRGISAETCSELMGITIATAVENYYRVTNRKIDAETDKAWDGL